MLILKTPSRNTALSFRDYFAGKGIQARVTEDNQLFIVESVKEEDDFLVTKELNFLKNQEHPEDLIVRAAWNSGSSDSGSDLPAVSAGLPLNRICTLTGLTVVACIAVFLLQSFMDGSSGRPVFDALSLNAAKFHDGEYWRLITPAFLHFGFVHIGFNTVIFAVLGWPLEKYLGAFRLLGLILISGITGNVAEYCILASAHEMSPENFGGLSGVVNGVIGYLAVLSRHPDLPPKMRLIPGLFTFTLIMIVVAGLFLNGIANAAHVGGLVAGMLMGILDFFLLKTGKLAFRVPEKE